MKFIYFHLRSDYALEMIKTSGIVEFSILLLDNSEKTNFNSFEDDDSDPDEKDQDRAGPQNRYDMEDLQYVPSTIAQCAFELINRLKSVWIDDVNADLGDIAS